MSAPTRIFLGDLVRAVSEVGTPSRDNWPEIAKLLGITWLEPAPQTLQVTSPIEERSADRLIQPIQKSSEEPQNDHSSEQDVGSPIDFEFAQTTADPAGIPITGQADQQAPANQTLTIQPLFDPFWERGILIEAVSTPIRQGDLDIAETVQLMARGQFAQDAPRELIPSVSKGCQVLIDVGVGMQPFADDTVQLVNSIRRSIGSGHTSAFTFVDCPSTGVLSDRYEATPYLPPGNGGIVLALSDLCKGGPRGAVREAVPADWLTLAKRIRDAGSSLVVLNPYPPERWPASLSQRIPILYWDRSTRTATVRRTRRTRRN